jgi:hypothetical protein
MDVAGPAVIAAIADATGVWICDLPATPEKLLAAIATDDAPTDDAPTDDTAVDDAA